jgi:hypothetical protein
MYPKGKGNVSLVSANQPCRRTRSRPAKARSAGLDEVVRKDYLGRGMLLPGAIGLSKSAPDG